MAANRQKRKLRILTLFLAVLMALSFCALLLTACSTSSEEEEDTTPSKTDTQTFPNADLEFYDDSNGSYLIGSPENWTSGTVSNGDGVSASSSVAKSGTVDTAPTDENGTALDWSSFLDAYNDYTYYDGLEDDDPALEDAEYYTDIDNYYDIPGWDIANAALGDGETLSDGAIRDAAIAANPGTHWSDESNAAELNEEKGTNVLMLHNYRTNGYGTATQYTSSSITLSAGTAASVSVWVKTYGLSYNDGTAVNGNRGAFISVVPTVGGTRQNALVVRNIDTQAQNPDGNDNGWVRYTFYLRAAAYSDTSFTVVLGLGRQAQGINSNYYEYVQGYAFFDDLTYQTMTSEEYAAGVADVPDGSAGGSDQQIELDLSYDSDDAKFDAASVTDNVFAYDLDTLSGKTSALTLSGVTVEDTTDDRELTQNTFASYFANNPAAKRIIDSAAKDEELSGVKSLAEITGHSGTYAYSSALLEGLEGLDELPFYNNDSILLLYSSEGLPYTAELSNSNVNGGTTDTPSDIFTLGKDERLLVSFWVKTSDLQGGTGATITLIDADTETAIGAVDTSTLTGVDLTDDVNEDREDIFGGWQLCSFFVSNTTEDDLSFSLEFSFGPTAIAGSAVSSYAPGYAAFTAFRTATLSEEESNILTTGTYAVSVSLAGDSYSSSTVFDDVAYTDQETIETGIADLRNYRGVFGGSTYVGGETLSNDGSEVNKNGINELSTAGLLNKDYADAYFVSANSNLGWMQVLSGYYSIADGITSWNAIFGADCTQPLLIANSVAQSYGFISTGTSSFSSSSWTAVTLRVKLSPGATARIYLIDTTAPDDSGENFGTEKQYTDTIKHTTGISYRYDADGNVVNLDPDDENFEQSNVLFHLQDNGLWTTGSNDDGVYYANLSNYDTDEDGNLVDSAGTIVYYVSDGAYYRYKDTDTEALSVQVRDFTEANIDLTGAVLQEETSHDLMSTVTNPSDTDVSDWIYVRFFVETGDESKSYRLEVWSGDRTGNEANANAADSFVIFDVVNYGTLDETTFDDLLNSQVEDLADELGYADTDALLEAYQADPAAFVNGITKNSAGEDISNAGALVYFHYSLYDDDDYASFDENYSDSTDPYADYDPSTYSDTVAYLSRDYTATSGTRYVDTFINYGASEITVASSSDDGTTDEDTTTAADPDYNVWLLAASIILAAVLVFTLIALLARKLFSDIRKKNLQKASPAYSNKRNIYIRKLRQEEATRDEEEPEAPEDDVLVGEDEEIPEDILYNERSLDEGAEEPAEGADETDGEGKPEDPDDKAE